MPNNNLTEDQIREAARNSYSIADMCRYLGMVPAGGNYGSIKRRIARYDIDVSHFTGQSWKKGKYLDSPNSKGAIKLKLIRERGHRCEKCKNAEWLDLPIALELEHIDGDNSNNVYDNLLLLCPNCHAQTDTWRRAKAPFVPKNPAPPRRTKTCECGAEITPQAKQCTPCAHKKQQRIAWPPVEELVARLRDNKESYSSVARSLGVSDNPIRKYLRKNGIDPKTFLPLA